MRRTRRAWLAPAVIAITTPLIGLVVAGILVAMDSASVRSPSGMHHVRFGFPMAAVTQDQSRFTPPTFPERTSFDSPLEAPTHVEVTALVVDSAVGGAAVLILIFATSMAFLRLRERGAALPA